MIISALAVVALLGVVYAGVHVWGMHVLFGIVVPYVAILLFAYGLIKRVMGWASSPVPFCIPTTCGQQKSLSWIESSYFDNPHTTVGVVGRMLLEVLCFRSLFRNVQTQVRDGRVAHGSDEWLWIGALAFHWCFLVIVIRHLRFLTEPVPFFVSFLEQVDGFFQVGLPVFLASGFIMLGAVTYLFARRLFSPRIRYISLPADYFPLFLIMGIACSGILLRHLVRTDVVTVKEIALGLVTLHPAGSGLLAKAHWLFFVHLTFVSVLIAYFPTSKLMHMAGVLLSPTRNLANNSRMVRHVNPWNYPVKVHTYEEYEDEFRDKMKDAGLPVEKE
ncbi:MAG: sulfate reduction electron transfer complex DsrMKJOP subunit DsrM [Candidatus Riflebacteria bacterium]|nr:sulfate reduction electron transfer complex DsrMKJOP subunit DsrM [Candidatus Riflebacteria bacterium]